jgi:hypothetical protein
MDHAKQGNESALKILHLILKIFYLANQLQVVPYLKLENNIAPWLSFNKQIMDMPVPEELSSFTEDLDEVDRRDKHVFWKIKQAAARMIYRMCSKYVRTDMVEKDDKAFSENIAKTFSEQLLESNLKILFTRKTNFVGTKTISFAIKFITLACKVDHLMEKLGPFID